MLSAGIGSFIEIIGDLTLGTALSLFIWYQGGGAKKDVAKKAIKRFCMVMGIEAIPYIDILPMWTIVILWTWYEVRKESLKNE